MTQIVLQGFRVVPTSCYSLTSFLYWYLAKQTIIQHLLRLHLRLHLHHLLLRRLLLPLPRLHTQHTGLLSVISLSLSQLQLGYKSDSKSDSRLEQQKQEQE